jgi:molecular chaperone GrpE
MSEQENEQDKQSTAEDTMDEATEEQPQPGEGEEPEAEAAADSDGADESGEDDIASLKERLEQAERKLAEADARAQAEIRNVRKRAEKDVESAHKFALDKFANDLLKVADSLERALATLDPEDEALQPAREGTELTLKALLDVFREHNIERVDPEGEVFDPEWHEAMTMVARDDMEPNRVVEVLEKGYVLNGRLLRPARVVVSKSEES